MRYIPYLLISMLLFLSCKHDEFEYKISNEEFISWVLPALQWRYELNKRMTQLPNYADLNLKSRERQTTNENYLMELKSMGISIPQVNQSPSLEQKIIELNALQQNNFNQYNRRIIQLSIESDQELIGYHVKATGSTGLVNPNLRTWAERQLDLFIKDLSVIQSYQV